jgi:hypothetical protein
VMVGGNPDKFGRNKLPKVFISKILMKILWKKNQNILNNWHST